MKIQNQQYIFPILILVTFLISYSLTFDKKLAPLGDNASYYMLGQAIAQGEGFVNISKIDKTPNNHFPPGYPAIMSIFMHVTQHINFFKILNGLFLIGGLLILYRILLRVLNNPLLSLIIILFCLLNYHLLQYGSLMMSEMPYLFFSLLAISALMNSKDDRAWYKDPNFYLALVSIVIAYHIRSLGITLLGAAVVSLAMRRQFIQAVAMGGAFVALSLPWFIRTQQLGGGSYMRQLTLKNPYQPGLGEAGFGDFIDRIGNNFSRYITQEIPDALFPFTEVDYSQSGTFGEWIAGLLLTGLSFYGLYKLVRYRWLILLYILFTLAILMIWPDVWVGVRFIVPLIPVLAAGLFHSAYLGIQWIFDSVKKPTPTWALFLFPLFLLSGVSQLHQEASAPLHPAWNNYYSAAEWLRRNESSNAVVACGKPALFYLYSQTYTVRYAFEQDPEKLIADLEKEKVDYVVIDQVYPNTVRYLVPAIRAHPERFEQVHYLPNPDTYLLRFKR